jgi:hypothetical protein
MLGCNLIKLLFCWGSLWSFSGSILAYAGSRRLAVRDIAYYYEEYQVLAIFVPCYPCSVIDDLSDISQCHVCVHSVALEEPHFNQCVMCGSVVAKVVDPEHPSNTRLKSVLISSDRLLPITFTRADDGQTSSAVSTYVEIIRKQSRYFYGCHIANSILFAQTIQSMPWIEFRRPVLGEINNGSQLPVSFIVNNINAINFRVDKGITAGTRIGGSNCYYDHEQLAIKFEDMQYPVESAQYLRLILPGVTRVSSEVGDVTKLLTPYELAADLTNNEGSGFFRVSIVSMADDSDDVNPLFRVVHSYEVVPDDIEFRRAQSFQNIAQTKTGYNDKLQNVMINNLGEGHIENESIHQEEKKKIRVMHVMGGGIDGSQNVVFQRWNLLEEVTSGANRTDMDAEFQFILLWICSEPSGPCELNAAAAEALKMHAKDAVEVRYFHGLSVAESHWSEGYVR